MLDVEDGSSCAENAKALRHIVGRRASEKPLEELLDLIPPLGVVRNAVPHSRFGRWSSSKVLAEGGFEFWLKFGTIRAVGCIPGDDPSSLAPVGWCGSDDVSLRLTTSDALTRNACPAWTIVAGGTNGGPKFAVCIVGGVDKLETPCVYERVVSNFLAPLKAASSMMSVFVLLKDFEHVMERTNHSDTISRVRGVLESHGANWKLTMPPADEQVPNCKVKANNGQGYVDSHPHLVIGQHLSWTWCLSEVERVEQERATEFDAIFKARSDLFWHQPIPTHLTQPDFDYTNTTYHLDFAHYWVRLAARRPSDHFFVLPRSLATNILGLGRDYLAACNKTGTWDFYSREKYHDLETLVWEESRKACTGKGGCKAAAVRYHFNSVRFNPFVDQAGWCNKYYSDGKPLGNASGNPKMSRCTRECLKNMKEAGCCRDYPGGTCPFWPDS